MQRAERVQFSRVVVAAAGPRAFRLSIGGIQATVVSGDPHLALTVPDAVSHFLVEGDASDIRVEARWQDDESHQHQRGRLLFDSGGLWQLRETDGQLVWTFTSPKFGRVPYKTAVFQPDFAAGAVYLHQPYFDRSEPIYPLEYPLDELVMTNWLALGRGVEIHGCAVCDADGAGYLFAGHSGAGKSTIARLWQARPDVAVLSDDRVIVRKIDNQIWMYGTPWHGDEPLASPARAPLTRGFFLRHASSNHIVSTPRAETVARLLTCSFPPFFSASGLEFTLAVLTEIAEHAPFCELGFVPDDHVPDFLRAMRH